VNEKREKKVKETSNINNCWGGEQRKELLGRKGLAIKNCWRRKNAERAGKRQ
jgi:hypothetical protein